MYGMSDYGSLLSNIRAHFENSYILYTIAVLLESASYFGPLKELASTSIKQYKFPS